MDAKATSGNPRVLISRSALLHNVAVLRRYLPESTKLCAVIKADGYGHGCQIVADALCNFSSDKTEAPAVDALAVATIEEAAALGQPVVPILVMRPAEDVFIGRQRAAFEDAIRAGWTLTIVSAAAAGDVARIAVSAGRRALVQVMIDSGMAREGAAADEVNDVIAAVESFPSLKLTGLCTHFAESELAGSERTAEQLASFNAVTQVHAWKRNVTRHAANTGAVFFCPTSHLDQVRPGLGLYGIDPTGRPSIDRPLRPAMKWISPILMERRVAKGDCVGYNHTWTAPRDSRLGLVPVGYADGYLRAFSNCAAMLVHGKPAPVVGRVSMDSTMIDLTDIPEAHAGDLATLLDNDPLSPASVYALARWADTIPYEIFCRIGPRVLRIGTDPADNLPKRSRSGAPGVSGGAS